MSSAKEVTGSQGRTQQEQEPAWEPRTLSRGTTWKLSTQDEEEATRRREEVLVEGITPAEVHGKHRRTLRAMKELQLRADHTGREEARLQGQAGTGHDWPRS